MATSGTYGLTTYDVIKMMELAYARCGVKADKITSGLADRARESLELLLQRIPSIARMLWTQKLVLYGTYANRAKYELIDGTLRVSSMQYRTIQYPSGGIAAATTGVAAFAFDQDTETACIQTLPDGIISYQFASQATVTTVGFLMYGAQTLDTIAEYSTDLGVTWNTLYDFGAATYADNEWVWQDVVTPPLAADYRLRQRNGSTMAMREICFGSVVTSYPMSDMNQDDYDTLPNKFASGMPVQYYFDRQIDPQIFIWQVPTTSFGVLAIRQTRQLQNVGDFTNTLEIPSRWYDAVTWNWAQQIATDVPEIEVPPVRMEIIDRQAAGSLLIVVSEESDSMPSNFRPDYTAYTK